MAFRALKAIGKEININKNSTFRKNKENNLFINKKVK
jgi:hypothetical protein